VRVNRRSASLSLVKLRWWLALKGRKRLEDMVYRSWSWFCRISLIVVSSLVITASVGKQRPRIRDTHRCATATQFLDIAISCSDLFLLHPAPGNVLQQTGVSNMGRLLEFSASRRISPCRLCRISTCAEQPMAWSHRLTGRTQKI